MLVCAVLGLACVSGCTERAPIEIKADSGIKTTDIRTGRGSVEVVEGLRVEVHYVCTLPDGTEIVNTRDRRSHRFIIGDRTVIPGLDLGIRGMREGGIREIYMPPQSHYGIAGYADVVPRNTPMTMRVELLAVDRPSMADRTSPHRRGRR
jgi:FKBP-type peptidyl-prolyl cis-trans isomerase